MSELKTTEAPGLRGLERGIGPLEAQVLRTVSELTPPVTVREVCDRLQKDGYFAYQGVLNCMNRLVKKGVLARTERHGAFLYQPLVDIEELTAQVVSNLLGSFGSRMDRVICRVLDIDPDLGAEELASLRQRIRAMERGPHKR